MTGEYLYIQYNNIILENNEFLFGFYIYDDFNEKSFNEYNSHERDGHFNGHYYINYKDIDIVDEDRKIFSVKIIKEYDELIDKYYRYIITDDDLMLFLI